MPPPLSPGVTSRGVVIVRGGGGGNLMGGNFPGGSFPRGYCTETQNNNLIHTQFSNYSILNED